MRGIVAATNLGLRHTILKRTKGGANVVGETGKTENGKVKVLVRMQREREDPIANIKIRIGSIGDHVVQEMIPQTDDTRVEI
jgi:hypothetical protein